MEVIYKETEIEELAPDIIKEVGSKTLCFHGPMGAGKTTLIKALVKELGAAQAGNSPTFGIVNEYCRKDGSLLGYHFDFYRLESEEEALDIGLEDYLMQDVWFFMEWPDKITSLIPNDAVNLRIDILDIETRRISID